MGCDTENRILTVRVFPFSAIKPPKSSLDGEKYAGKYNITPSTLMILRIH